MEKEELRLEVIGITEDNNLIVDRKTFEKYQSEASKKICIYKLIIKTLMDKWEAVREDVRFNIKDLTEDLDNLTPYGRACLDTYNSIDICMINNDIGEQQIWQENIDRVELLQVLTNL